MPIYSKDAAVLVAIVRLADDIPTELLTIGGTNTQIIFSAKAGTPISLISSTTQRPSPRRASRIFDLILKVASGQPTKSEEFDFSGAEFAPWLLGATM
jgi:hypothetical protein